MKNNKSKNPKKPITHLQSKETIREKPSHHILCIFLILIISITIYSNTLKNGFVYDDKVTIFKNTLIKNLNNLPKLFKTEYFEVSGENSYRPVVTLTYFIDYWLYGLKPWGYHLTNVLLHAMNGVLLYIFLMLVVEARNKMQEARQNMMQETGGNWYLASYFLPLVSSLIFATHPVLTEAVNAISFREDLLCFLFFISALIIYIRGKSYLASYFLPLTSCFFYLLALLSKEMAITFPLIIFLYEWIYGGKREHEFHEYLSAVPAQADTNGTNMKEINNKFIRVIRPFVSFVFKFLFNHYIIGYIAVTVFYLYLRFYLFHNPFEESISAWLLSERLITIPYLISKYLLLLIAPVSLSADYVITPVQSLISPKFIILFIIVSVLVLVSVNSVRTSKTQSQVTSYQLAVSIFGILFLLLTLLPVYGIIPIFNPFAERYLYLPTVGFAIIAGSIIHEMFKIQSRYILITFVAILSIYSFAVIQRNKIWADNYSLWSDTVIKMPKSARGHYSLGNIYAQQGQFDDAIKKYKLALTLKPDYAEAHNSLGNVYVQQGRLDDAIKEYKSALTLKSDFADAHFSLGLIYKDKGLKDEAIKEFTEVLKLNIGDKEAHNNLGNVYAQQGRFEEAIKEYELSLTIKPDDSEAHNNLGNVYAQQGRFEEAIKEYELSLTINPDNSEAHNNLGNIYTQQGRFEDAIKEFKQALTLKSDFADAHFNLGLVYKEKGLKDEAINEFTEILKLNPEDKEAQYLIQTLLP